MHTQKLTLKETNVLRNVIEKWTKIHVSKDALDFAESADGVTASYRYGSY